MPSRELSHDPIILDDTFILAAERVYLSKNGNYLIGEDSTGVSYFAEVKGHKIVGYFCEDSNGSRIPSFVIQDAKTRPVDRNGVQTNLLIKGVHPNNLCFCCHRQSGGGYRCHPIVCP